MKMNKIRLRIVSLLLCLTMIFGMAPAIQLFTAAEATSTTQEGSSSTQSTHEESDGWQSINNTTANVASLFAAGGKFVLNSDIELASVTVANDLRICLNGHTIYGTGGGNMFTVKKASGAVTFTICDCGQDSEGAVDASRKTAGDTIVSVQDNATFNLHSGKLTGKTGSAGGPAVRVEKGTAVFNMTGGTITENSYTSTGTAAGAKSVYITAGGQFNMSGGEITGNLSPNKAGIPSVFVRNGGTVTLSKTAKFDDDSFGQIGTPAATLQVKELADGALIVSTAQLTFDENDTTVKETVANNTYTYTYKAPVSDPEARVGNQDYKTLAEAIAAVTSTGTVTLLKDVSLDGLTEITNGVNLTVDLNSKKLSATGEGNVFTLIGTEAAPVSLTIKDSLGGGVIDASGKTSGDTIIAVFDYATFNLEGGKLTGKASSVSGAAVRVEKETSVFNMYGGQITGNNTATTNATAAHSVLVKGGGSFTMYGGEISGNTPEDSDVPSVRIYNGGTVVFTGTAVFNDGGVSESAVVKQLVSGANITTTNALTQVSGDNTVKVTRNGSTYTYEAYRIANWDFFTDDFENYTVGENAFQAAASISTGAAYPYWQCEVIARPDYLPMDILEDGENQFLKMTTVNSVSSKLITKYRVNGAYTLRMDFLFDSATTDYNVLSVSLAGDNTIEASDGKTMQQKLNVQLGSGNNGIWWPHVSNLRILNADGTRMMLADDTWYTMEYTLELGKMTVSVWPAGNESAKRSAEWVSSDISEEVFSQANTARIQVTGKEGNTRVVCLDNIHLSKPIGLDMEDSVTVQAGNVLSSLPADGTRNQQPAPHYSYETENPELGYTNQHGQFIAGYKDAADTTVSTGKTKLTVTLLDLRGNETDVTFQTELNVTAPSGGNTGGTLKVLAIGNSFTADTLEYVSRLAKVAGADIDISYLSWGAANGIDGKLQHHAYNLANNIAGYKWYVTDSSTHKLTLSSSSATISEKVESQAWDVIILQQQATSAGIRGTFNGDLEYLVDYLEDVQPNAKLYWNMTWALKDGFEGGSKTIGYNFKDLYGSDTKVMYNAIVRNLEEFIVGDEAMFSSTNPNNLGTGIGWGFDGCLFTGAAIQNVRGTREPTQDSYHLSTNLGRMTAGMTVVKTLYDDFALGGTGVKLHLSTKFTWDNIKGMLTSGYFWEDVYADYYYTQNYLSKIHTAADAAATADGVPAKLTVTQTKPEDVDDQANASVQVEAPNKLYFPDVKTLDNGVMLSVLYESVHHLGATYWGDGNGILAAGSSRLVLFESQDNGHSWNAANPILVIDEQQLQEWNIVSIYDRYASIGAGTGKNYAARADARDPNLATTYVDFDGDGDEEQVVIVTFWIQYYDAEENSFAPTNLWMLTGVRNDNGSYTWAAPKVVFGATQKRGDIATFSDGEILVPGYAENVVRMVWSANQQTWIEKHVYSIPNLAPGEADSITFSEVSLVAPDPDEDTVFAFCRDNGTVLKSIDRGENWELIANEEGLIDQPGFAIIDKNTVFVTWARTTERPRKTYGKIFYVHADWNDTEAVLIYDSAESAEHDTGDPSCAINADGDVVVVSYDVAYRSVVYSIVSLDNESWAAPQFTVTFDNGVTQSVAYGDRVVKPTDPTKDGYVFGGWYNGDEAHDFSTSVIGDLVLNAKWHTPVVDAAVAPSCTETGLTEGSHCSVCGEVLVKQEVVPAAGHSWDDGVVTLEPTTTTEGVKTYTCGNCKDTKEEPIPVIEINASIDFTGASLLFKDEIKIKFYMTVNGISGDMLSNAGIEVWSADEYNPDNLINPTTVYSGLEKNQDQYQIITDGIPAKNMGDLIYVRAFLEIDGVKIYSPRVISYSPVKYSEYHIGRAASDPTNQKKMDMAKLCIGLMNYGAEAQKYFAEKGQYTYTTPMNSFITAEQQAWLDTAADITPTKDIPAYAWMPATESKIKLSGISGVFKGALQMKLYVTAGATGNVKMLYWTEATAGDELLIENAAEMSDVSLNGATYEGYMTGIAAKNSGDTLYICAAVEIDGEICYTKVVAYSMHKYAGIEMDKASAMAGLSEALVIYSNVAKEYMATYNPQE